MRHWLFCVLLSACHAAPSHSKVAPTEKSEPRASKPTSKPTSSTSTEPRPEPEPLAGACAEQYRDAFDKASPAHTAAALKAAAECFRGAGQVGLEVRAWTTLADSFPNAPEAKEALRSTAQAYESVGHTADAARFYEDYARRYPKEPDAADALKSATCFRHSFGDKRAVEQDLGELRRRHKIDADLAELCAKTAAAP
jgi:hypothetical protein